MERRDFLKRAGLGAAGASATITGIGTLVSPALADGYSVRCPYAPDNYYGTGETMGKALEQLTIHIREAHTSNIPEPVRTQVKNSLTACANAFGPLPV